MATISKTSTFQVPKIFSEFFSPSFGWVLPVACLRPRLLRRNTAALGSLQRQRFRGREAPGGEGGRGCEGRRRPWPRRRISVGKPHEALGFCCEVHEDVDGSSCLVVRYCFQFLWRESAKILFAPTFGVFCCLHVFCTPLVTEIYRVYRQDRHVLLTIRSDHFIPKLITIFQHRLMNPDILTR